ncbi:MAG: translation initiation factor IF-2, partial [Clostridia bacterium]|nr:translation initiation factor IF-2 [Clostridia bacterium]
EKIKITKSEITVKELAEKINLNASDIIKKLMAFGIMASINENIDLDTAAVVAEESGYEIEFEEPEEEKVIEEEILLAAMDDDPKALTSRPPVVTVMGHVDHGKTTLLDAIRDTRVTEREAGGITQHIGAYQVEADGKYITFLDTPGHEAFTAMRARGAQATDIAVLVVAADDGVMPQTVEAINHAKAGNIPIIVAINKIDRPEASPDRIKQQLAEHDLIVEEWGGEIICVDVSAIKGQGIDSLLEMILLVAEIEELKANPNQAASGIIIDSQLDRGRGPVATGVIQNGTLNIGDSIIVGTTYGRVRSMTNDRGQRIEKAPPSMPVQIQGFAEVPLAGEGFQVIDEKTARSVAMKRKDLQREQRYYQRSKVSVDDLLKQMGESGKRELNIVLKSDAHGSAEALMQSLEKIESEEVKVNIIHNGVGAVSETDVMLAAASQAIIIGFNVRPDTNANRMAETEGVEIKLYRVIYEAIENVKQMMAGMLEPKYKEKYLGRAEVREIFKVPRAGVIAGSYLIDGKITNKSKARLIRDGVIAYEGRVGSLRRFKDDVREVEQGYECGIGIENYNDIKIGDIIEAFVIEEVERKL